MKQLDTTHTIFSHEAAEKVAAELRAGDPDWTYKVVKNPNPDGPKTAIIKIFDEDGEFVTLV